MKFVSSIIALCVLFISLMSVSLGAEPNRMQKAELNSLITQLNIAAENKNMSVIANNMPTRLFKEMARRLNTKEMALRDNLVEQLENQFANLPAGAYHLDNNNISYHETQNKTFYALVPTRVETNDTIAHYQTLAIFDNTKWHLIYGGQKTVQNPIFLEIYPAFKDVSIPEQIVTTK
ncbi:hypothetical protein [Bartonella tamiae]|uniref:Uncharacterized protein n=1 Tax=Bartonella tamiae Th239 TaxID=1094558 RepID=J1JVM7_9HYPH|nr:hypothetical protein [Bartonella tamiae]EJF89012.1 hypothetical protein ME5_01563 [Bartonella tamiae Th239]EJF94738.1 hypothetical protein MEG_00319 [Bartonella tamiae Th307]